MSKVYIVTIVYIQRNLKERSKCLFCILCLIRHKIQGVYVLLRHGQSVSLRLNIKDRRKRDDKYA